MYCFRYYGIPTKPDIPGEETFTGDVLHSWQYRDPANYQGKKVLLVGSGTSVWDISWDLSPNVSEVHMFLYIV